MLRATYLASAFFASCIIFEVALATKFGGKLRSESAAFKQPRLIWSMVDVESGGLPVSPEKVAVISVQFRPTGWHPASTANKPRLFNCAQQPHPLGKSNQFVFTNSAQGEDETCWQSIFVRGAECRDAESCCMMAKNAKMPLATEKPAFMAALAKFDYVLYIDDKITMSRTAFQGWMQRASAANAGHKWSLIVRAHEAGVGHDVNDEMWAAMHQPRYASHRMQITDYMNSRADVQRHGQMHNTGILLWNMHAPKVRELQQAWLEKTRATSCECQITFFYVFHDFGDSVVTVPFSQPGVTQWGKQTLLARLE